MGRRLGELLHEEGFRRSDAELVGSNAATILACLVAMSRPKPWLLPEDCYFRIGLDVECDRGVTTIRVDAGLPHHSELIVCQEGVDGVLRQWRSHP